MLETLMQLGTLDNFRDQVHNNAHGFGAGCSSRDYDVMTWCPQIFDHEV